MHLSPRNEGLAKRFPPLSLLHVTPKRWQDGDRILMRAFSLCHHQGNTCSLSELTSLLLYHAQCALGTGCNAHVLAYWQFFLAASMVWHCKSCYHPHWRPHGPGRTFYRDGQGYYKNGVNVNYIKPVRWGQNPKRISRFIKVLRTEV